MRPGRDVDDAGRAVLGVRDHAGLAAGERAGVVAQAADRHGEQRHRDALAGGEQHVELARRRDRRDLVGEVEQLVGGVAHGADGDDDVVAGLARLDDALRDALDALGVGDGGSAELLHDQAHERLLGLVARGARRTAHLRSDDSTECRRRVSTGRAGRVDDAASVVPVAGRPTSRTVRGAMPDTARTARGSASRVQDSRALTRARAHGLRDERAAPRHDRRIALGVATGGGGEADQGGALGQLASRPGGVFVLWLIVVGLGHWACSSCSRPPRAGNRQGGVGRAREGGRQGRRLPRGRRRRR